MLMLLLVSVVFLSLLSRFVIHKGRSYLAKKTLHVQLVNSACLRRYNFRSALTSSILFNVRSLEWSRFRQSETKLQRNRRLLTDSKFKLPMSCDQQPSCYLIQAQNYSFYNSFSILAVLHVTVTLR